MKTAFTTIIGIIIGALGTYFAYLLQSRRDTRILWKNRNRFLYKLIAECSKQAKAETEHVIEWVLSVRADLYTYPIIKQSSSSKVVFDAFAEKIMLDEYYFAYNRFFVKLINAEESYRDLQLVALHLKALYGEIIRMISDGQSRHHNREKEALNLFKEATEWVNAHIPSCTPQARPFLQAFRTIHNQFNVGKGKAFPANLVGVYNNYFLQADTAIKSLGVLPNDLIPLGAIMNKYGDLYNEIPFQNNALADDLEEMSDEIEKTMKGLIEVKRFWDNDLRPRLHDY